MNWRAPLTTFERLMLGLIVIGLGGFLVIAVVAVASV